MNTRAKVLIAFFAASSLMTIILFAASVNHTIDQCVRVELFKECVNDTPAALFSTDRAKIIEACDTVAVKQSYRAYSTIEDMCRSH